MDTDKRAAYAQAYSASDITVARITGQYPPRDHLSERIGATLMSSDPGSTDPTPSLYERLVAAGCEIGNHESDLHVKNTDQAFDIIKAYQAEGGSVTISPFRSAIDGSAWIDIPFHFNPWWDKKMGDNARSAAHE